MPGFDLDFENVNNRLVWFDGEEKSSEMLFVFLVVALVALFVNMRQTLKSPYVQRTMLMAKSLGPKIAGGKKKRSA